MDSGSTALNPNGEVVEEQSALFLASLAKGLTVVRSFNQRRPDMSLKEISQVNNLTMGSTQRIAHTLEVMGILTRDPRSKRYRLGVGSLNYGSQYLQTEL